MPSTLFLSNTGKSFILLICFTLSFFCTPFISFAQQTEGHKHETEAHEHPDQPHIHDELEQIKKRLKVIEHESERRRITGVEERKELGDEAVEAEKAYPVLSSRRTRLNGGLTFIVQGVLNNEDRFVGNRADASLSLDLILESELREGGLLIVRGDFMRGEGLTHLPDLFSRGVNADIEDFTGAPESFRLIEALYEQTWDGQRFRFSFGQIDLTSYFDQNEYANSETFQFISPLFVNNIAITWGGDVNGYGPGLVFHVHPNKSFEFNLGLFEGDGNYTDTFDQSFVVVEVEFETYRGDLEGHYRFILWSNETNQETMLDPSLTASHNRGIAISFDKAFTEHYAMWLRFGIQDGAVSKFDRHASLGLQIKGPLGQRGDIFGIAFGTTWIGDEYEQASGLDKNEYSAEAYYNIALAESVYISPDLLYIGNPGGDGSIDPITVYGMRAQLVF